MIVPAWTAFMRSCNWRLSPGLRSPTLYSNSAAGRMLQPRRDVLDKRHAGRHAAAGIGHGKSQHRRRRPPARAAARPFAPTSLGRVTIERAVATVRKRTAATLPTSPSSVGMICISTVVSPPGLSVPSDQTNSPLGPCEAVGEVPSSRVPRGISIANLDVGGGSGSLVADDGAEHGRPPHLNLRRHDLLQDDAGVLRSFQSLVTRLPGAAWVLRRILLSRAVGWTSRSVRLLHRRFRRHHPGTAADHTAR